MKTTIVVLVLFGCIAVAQTFAQTPVKKPAAQPATSAYDTKAQTQAKVDALFAWTLENTSAGSPGPSRPGYALQVLDILEHIRVPRITQEMYERMDTNAYADDSGDFIATAWLVFGQLPTEISRTSAGDTEIVVYQWKNSDGGNFIGTFRNGQLVSKAQSGLPSATPGSWNPEVSQAALVDIRAKRGIKVK